MEPWTLEFPAELPVSTHRESIMAAIQAHPVVIVCGETGSGKTTQLPKMALALGRSAGPQVQADGRRLRARLIGHTQPRRIAAATVAQRLADELQTPLGQVVGYKVRFSDRLSAATRIKLMTDGILLAETQTDPLLQAYDTLIIDEAHERSLNIDFLLGFLKQLLPRRTDLKLIVTSATIDAQRFANHFASAVGPAPVIQVSGRLYPVEMRWRPFEASRERDLNQALADAVDELWRNPHAGGDILVFLPGEREIRDATDHLRGHLQGQVATRGAQVLPLFARLSPAEQARVFQPHGVRRVVLATNVAETSLTVPGIHFVIDAGTARVKRYSYRSKVEQLLIEPISQAAANQRAGRCGRVADGVCIRLYDEADFARRPAYTDPEILRSSLAGVILRMKALHLGSVEDFPFLERPSGRAIADGYQLLQELGALDDTLNLTAMGREMARLPLDPRVARMLLEARQRQSLAEVLVLAAALAGQDVRDRPLEAQAQADQAHAPFKDDKSEFVGTLRLWRWIQEGQGGVAGAPRLSHRQAEQRLRHQFINPRRVREWQDLYQQLHTVTAEHGWHLNTEPATYEQIHLALLAGLLGNVGCKLEGAEAGADYLGARGIKFVPHPGAHLRKKLGRWVVGAELVETSRLFARGLASIDPVWLEQVGAHLLKKQVLDPHWEKRSAEVVGLERATLYGLVVYSGRRVGYARIDPVGARELFIRSALVEGDWEVKLPFLAANQKLVAQVQDMEHKARRQDVLVDESLIHAFYAQQIPESICNGRDFEAWYRAAVKLNPKLLMLTREELMRHEAAGITTEAFPAMIRLGGVDCAARYLHEPGDPRDGVTVTVPLFVLNQVQDSRGDWLVPGMLRDKLLALLKTLPQRPRSRLVPLPDAARRLAEALSEPAVFGQGELIDAVRQWVQTTTGLAVARTDFKPDQLPAHHQMALRLIDDSGRQLAVGRSLAAIKAQWGTQARGAFQALAALKGRPAQANQSQQQNPPLAPVNTAINATDKVANPDAVVTSGSGVDAPIVAGQRHTAWTFGTWPELLEVRQGKQLLIGYPALVDDADAVTLTVFDDPDEAVRVHRLGLRRLFALQVRDALKYLEKTMSGLQTMGVVYMQVGRLIDPKASGGTLEALRAQIVEVALDRAFLSEPLPLDEWAFRKRCDEGRSRLTLIAQEVARQAGTVLQAYAAATRKLKDVKPNPDLGGDVAQHLARLVPLSFLSLTPWAALAHVPRYLQGVTLRLDKWRADPARDAARLAEFKPLEQRYLRLLAQRKGVGDARLEEFRWLLEELRVSLFAQELRTAQPVSVKRLEKAWTLLNQ